ncbi:chemotaxis protein CheA [Oxalobacteraceae bacterium A2-2]
MTTMLEQFLSEGRDFIQSIGASLLALERTPDDARLMDELFRVVHTLKGNCGMFDFPDMFRVIHAAEDLMSEVREGRLPYTRECADALLETLDFITIQFDEIELAGAPSAGHAARSAQLAGALAALTGERQAAATPEPPTSAPALRLPAMLALLPAGALPAWQAQGGLTMIEYRPEADCFFKGEDPLYQVLQLEQVVWRSVSAEPPWPALDVLDPYQCRLVFRLLTRMAPAAVEHHFRYVPEQVWYAAVPAADSAPAADAPQRHDEREAALLVASQRLGLQAPDWVPGRVQAALATIRHCLVALGQHAALPGLESAAAAAFGQGAAAPLLAWLDAYQGAEAGSVAAAPASAGGGDGGMPPPPPPQDAAEPRDRRADDQPGARVLKVEQAKVDRLMNLIGEMVVARNGLPYLAARAEQQYGVRELAREIKTQHGVINRIVEDMQDAIMQVRMTPVSFVFQRFPRLVRDIARRLGKEVELVLEGENTEADKNVIEALADPLVHIVRNSLDHGLETPEQRAEAGKPPGGRLTIGARQEADRVLIEISDDGRGIDPQRVKRKAYEKGLLDEAALERLSDQEAVNLVFLPGFSTADQVSDLSGRGVGMDAVRSAIAKLNGTVSLSSTPGAGTRLQLALPLSMAVTNVMTVRSGGTLYGIPMDNVAETVRLPRADVRGIKQHQTAVLRNRVLPLHGLNALLALPAPQQANADDELAVLVLRLNGEYVGIVVDDFREVVEVILKPMGGILASLTAYAGSALLGDGSVLMILNPGELLR